MKTKVNVGIEFFIHATEDKDKIFHALYDNFGIKEEDFDVGILEGHFGNPIIRAVCKLGTKESENFLRLLVTKIEKDQLQELLGDISYHIRGRTLFLRIAKQSLLRNSVLLQQKDAIRIKITAPIYNKNEITNTYVRILSLTN